MFCETDRFSNREEIRLILLQIDLDLLLQQIALVQSSILHINNVENVLVHIMFRVNVVLPAIAPKIKKVLHVKFVTFYPANETFLFNVHFLDFEVFSVFPETRNNQPENNIHQHLIHHQIIEHRPNGLNRIIIVLYFYKSTFFAVTDETCRET